MKKYFKGIAILILIAIGALLVLFIDIDKPIPKSDRQHDDTSLEDQINSILRKTPILFSKSDGIYKLEELGKPEIKISDQPGMVSPDGEKIAFVVKGDNVLEDEAFVIEIIDSSEKFNVYANNIVSWSPDSKYLITDGGTDVERSNGVFSWDQKQDIYSFMSLYSEIRWINNSDIIYPSNNKDYNNRPWGFGHGFNLMKLNIPTRKENIFMEASETVDYGDGDNYIITSDTNKVFFTRSKSSDSWIDDQTTEHISVDFDGNNLEVIDYDSIFNTKLLNYFDLENNIQVIDTQYNILNPEWVLVEFGESQFTTDKRMLGVVNRNDPKETATILNKGYYATWNVAKL